MTELSIDGISVISPVYCSSKTLPLLAKRIADTMVSLGMPYEIILVDDFSPDNSWEIINRLSSIPEVKGLRLKTNYGQMAATLVGMSIAKGKYIITIDDDLEYAPEDIGLLYQSITATKADVVFGLSEEKYDKQGGHPRLASWRNAILNRLWRKPVTDSFKILDRSVVFDNGSFLPTVHFEAFIATARVPISIAYCSVSYHRRAMGSSHHNFIKKAGLFFKLTFDYYRLRASQLFVILILITFLAYPALSYPAAPSSVIILSMSAIVAGMATWYFFAQKYRKAIPPECFDDIVSTKK